MGDADPKSMTPRQSRRRRWTFRLVTAGLAPVLFLVLLELTLRLIAFGYPTSYLVEHPDGGTYLPNRRFSWQHFHPHLAPAPSPFSLTDPKPDGTFRVFVVGGSAAMGIPDSAFGVARYLQTILETQYPGRRFEVVNTGLNSINSHVVLQIVRDCARFEPDLFVVYVGNNEVVGPYGPGTIFHSHQPSLPLIRAGIAAGRLHTGQLVQQFAAALKGRNQPLRWEGMKMFLDRPVSAHDPRLDQVYRNYEKNLRDIFAVVEDSSAHAVVSTLVTNLRDSSPFASETAPDQAAAPTYENGTRLADAGEYDKALTALTAALPHMEHHAELHFRLARCYAKTGNPAAARRHFIQARELDTLRFRADSTINDIVRDVATSAGESVTFVDGEQIFMNHPGTPLGVPGTEWLYEHVHFTPEGNHLLALSVAAAIEPLLGPPAAQTPSAEACADKLALSDWERYLQFVQINQMMGQPPFTFQIEYEAHQQQRVRAMMQLAGGRTEDQMRQQAWDVWQAALPHRQDKLTVLEKLLKLAGERRDGDGALHYARALLELFPDYPPAHTQLGSALLATGQADQAVEHLTFAVAARPGRPEIRLQLGTALESAGRFDHVIDMYRRAVADFPDYRRTRRRLAVLLATHPEPRHRDGAEALEHADALCKLSDYGEANDLAILAAAMAELGRFDDAVAQVDKALTLVRSKNDPRTVKTLETHRQLYQQKQPLRLPTRRAAQAASVNR